MLVSLRGVPTVLVDVGNLPGYKKLEVRAPVLETVQGLSVAPNGCIAAFQPYRIPMSHLRHINLAIEVSRTKDDDRRFKLGAVGLRKDGTLVASCNGNPKEPDRKHHAEYRVSRKLDRGSVVYVARTWADGTWANAKPCPNCMKALCYRKVTQVYWTVSRATLAWHTFS